MSTHISSSNPLSRKAPSKQPLKLVPAPVREADPNSEMLVAGGLEASPEMQPGQYVAVCEGARPYPQVRKGYAPAAVANRRWTSHRHWADPVRDDRTVQESSTAINSLWEAMQDRDGGRG